MSSVVLTSSNVWSNVRGLARTMRPQQWTKNVVIYAGLVFDGKLLDASLLLQTTLLFAFFCLASSAVYVLNDLVDVEKDRQHPSKRLRPLPNGDLNPTFAAVGALLLASVSLLGSFWLDLWVGVILVVYLLQNVAYSLYLKNLVIIDVMVVSFGFLLRVLAGVVLVHVARFSPWLYVCVALLTLFLGFGKRRHEIVLLEGEAGNHRASLDQYNLTLLDQIIVIVTTSTLMAYTFYTFEAKTLIVGDARLLLTVPFVLYGILRYLYLIHVRKLGGAPDELLLRDKPLLINGFLWVVAVVVLIYFW